MLRANSGLTSAQYSTPVLGLIFLRFAEARFAKRRDEMENTGASGRRASSRIDDPDDYDAEGVVYLTPNARYEHLLSLPEGTNVGQAVNQAKGEIEKHNPATRRRAAAQLPILQQHAAKGVAQEGLLVMEAGHLSRHN
jgi:type I restriction enzyme M protein